MSFIEERCRALNSGLPISDEFETEIANMDRLKMQTVNPEVIQQAVQSVKENASDVIGALKDRVTGIQVSFAAHLGRSIDGNLKFICQA
ncbi:hypothetical protein Y032_0004g2236 [Ancylostoma ceylanicum]|uniref:Uncharacterized protein n=1 Tax=Ancylostoma ceylanicum TaxID=53326 RepID=A0A016VXY3_9BILA|nr:hypothetical protein Y032_0004g2236 [Ancylostoma ceylanicum]